MFLTYPVPELYYLEPRGQVFSRFCRSSLRPVLLKDLFENSVASIVERYELGVIDIEPGIHTVHPDQLANLAGEAESDRVCHSRCLAGCCLCKDLANIFIVKGGSSKFHQRH